MLVAGWFFLAMGAIGYGFAHFFQASAAMTTEQTSANGFFRRLVSHRIYWYGLIAQLVAATSAVAARKELPLFLVQGALTAGIGVTAILGVIKLGWRLPRAEITLLIIMALGLTMLIASARSSSSLDLDTRVVIVLAALPVVFALLALGASRVGGVAGSVALGALAGLGFSAAAVSSRPLANSATIGDLLTDPLLYTLIANGLVAQITLAQAFRAGSTTAAIASLDAAGAAPAALVGVWILGDSVRPGFEIVAIIGFIMTIGAVVALARYAEPQAHPRATPTPAKKATLADVHT